MANENKSSSAKVDVLNGEIHAEETINPQSLIPNDEEMEKLLLQSAKSADVRQAIENIVEAQNMWFVDDEPMKAHSVDEKVKRLIKHYTLLKKRECYNECFKSEVESLTEACLRMTYLTVKWSVSPDKETGIELAKISETTANIDIMDMSDFAVKKKLGGIGVDVKWVNKIEGLNLTMAIAAGQAVGDPRWANENLTQIKDSFNMRRLSRQLLNGETPTSRTQRLKALDGIVKMMIGDEYKAKSTDLNMLELTYASLDKKKLGKIRLPNHATVALALMSICNNAMTGRGYEAISAELNMNK